MPVSFTDEQRALLDQPNAFARVATTLADGSPQLTVIWYRRDGDTIRMACERDALKARNLRRDPRVALVVERPGDPYIFIQLRGHAEVIDDIDLAFAEFEVIAPRYMGERAAAWLDTMRDFDGSVIVIQPERVSMSDNSV